MSRKALLAAVLAGMMPFVAFGAESLNLYAAGSLRAAMSQLADAFEKAGGTRIERVFGPSGLLRERIENGEPAGVFASASLKHPRLLEEKRLGGPVTLFARNRLCALARPDLAVSTENLLDALLDPNIRLGTSTPNADPAGDYAWELFRKAGAQRSGAFEKLDRKALKLTGGPRSEKPPAGRNAYAWVLDSKKADLFLTYCTNAVLARKEIPELEIVAVPAELAVGAEYGLIVLDKAPDSAARFALFVLSQKGQAVLESFGFETCALPGSRTPHQSQP